MLELLARLDTPVLRLPAVGVAGRVERRHVAVPPRAQVHLVQVQPVRPLQILVGVPKHSAVNCLPWKTRFVKFDRQVQKKIFITLKLQPLVKVLEET